MIIPYGLHGIQNGHQIAIGADMLISSLSEFSVIFLRQYDPTLSCASQEGGDLTNPIRTASVV